MQILADRLRQNYPECRLGKMSEDMNLKRPLFYQNGTDFKKNKVYITRASDLTPEQLAEHGDKSGAGSRMILKKWKLCRMEWAVFRRK